MSDKMRLFVSQPMNGKTEEEIKHERAHLVRVGTEEVRKEYGDGTEVEVVDSFFEDAPHDASPLWYLGESIKLLGTADVAIFASDWESARGCRIEHQCAIDYELEVIESYSEWEEE